MKMCNTEAMKRIKELEEKKNQLIYNENRGCTVSYKEGEEKTNVMRILEQKKVPIRRISMEVRRL